MTMSFVGKALAFVGFTAVVAIDRPVQAREEIEHRPLHRKQLEGEEGMLFVPRIAVVQKVVVRSGGVLVEKGLDVPLSDASTSLEHKLTAPLGELDREERRRAGVRYRAFLNVDGPLGALWVLVQCVVQNELSSGVFWGFGASGGGGGDLASEWVVCGVCDSKVSSPDGID